MKKTPLCRVYRGLYYPVMWGLQSTIVRISKQPGSWKEGGFFHGSTLAPQESGARVVGAFGAGW